MTHPTNNCFELKPGSVYIDTQGGSLELLLCTKEMYASIAKEVSPNLQKGYCMIGLYSGGLWDNAVPDDQVRYKIWDDELAVELKKQFMGELK